MTEMYGIDYPELVKDRDGDQMPFNPEVVNDLKFPDDTNLDWKTHWCRCGHLVVDHHFDQKADPKSLEMPCWAVGCECRLVLG